MPRIVGAAKDLERAKAVLGDTHAYMLSPARRWDILETDIVVGGIAAAGGVPWGDVKRIAGNTVEDTEWALIEYAMRRGILPDVPRLMDKSITRLAKIGYLSKSLKKSLMEV